MRLRFVPLILVLLCAAPVQGVRVVTHVVPGGMGLNDGYRPFPVFCRGNTVLVFFQTKPKLKVTPGPSEGRVVTGVLSLNPSLRRFSARNGPGATLNPNEIEVSCQHGQAQVRAGRNVQLERRP